MSEGSGEEYVVEKILGHKIGDDGKVMYEVKWKGMANF
jgi:hypothetical protein